MKKLKYFIIIVFTVMSNFLIGQTNIEKKLEEAQILKSNQDFKQSIKLFRELYENTTPKDELFNQIAVGFYLSLSDNIKLANELEDWKLKITLSKDYIYLLENKEDFKGFAPFLINKYTLYSSIVQDYIKLGERDSVLKYQKILHESYKNNSIPLEAGLNKSYEFDHFIFKGKMKGTKVLRNQLPNKMEKY